MATDAPALDRIAATVARAGSELDPPGQAHALALLRALAEGNPVSAALLAERTGQSPEQATAFVEELPAVYRDDDGDVIGFWGLTVIEMPPHRYRVNGRDLHTWCAWDPFILTPWLGGEAEVRSLDARTGEAIGFRITGGDLVSDLSHDDLTLSFTLTDEWAQDVIARFCHFVHYFTDEASAVAWTDENPGTFALPLADAVELGRVWGQAVWPDLGPSDR